MSDAIEVMPMRQTRNLLYDGDGRVVGVWFVPTGRGMFYDCFIGAQSKFGFPICTRWHHETESGGYCAWAERKGGDA